CFLITYESNKSIYNNCNNHEQWKLGCYQICKKNRWVCAHCCIFLPRAASITDFLMLSDSERSDECIDFTIMCVSANFQKKREKQKKDDGKTGIFTQNQFSTKSIFFYGCNSKTNHCKYLKFSPNVYVSVIYIIHVDKKFLDDQKVPYDVYISNFYDICRKIENLQD
ncbi:Uncharacterized protein FWK35_00027037, partial [Aphis craccivora]